jgi:hypothetical protein
MYWVHKLHTNEIHYIFTVYLQILLNHMDAIVFCSFSLVLRKSFVDFACWALINFMLFSPCIFYNSQITHQRNSLYFHFILSYILYLYKVKI